MGQKMKNAPLYFTIAQARYNPVLSLKTYMPDIQEHMRNAGYPDFTQGVTMVFNIALAVSGDASQPPPPPVQHVDRYVFSNMERTRGFILQPNALSFQATQYDTFELFSSEFKKGLEIVHKFVGLNFSERIGIRYLDAVVPKSGEDISMYLVPEVLGISSRLKLNEIIHSFSETLGRIDSIGQVIARTLIQNRKLGFPPDIQLDGLKLMEKFANVECLHAIIDTDGAFEGRETFDIAKIMKRLDELHNEASNSFQATITDFARSVWQ